MLKTKGIILQLLCLVTHGRACTNPMSATAHEIIASAAAVVPGMLQAALALPAAL